MKQLLNIDTVLFDLDNTLTDRDAAIAAYIRRFMGDFSNVLQSGTPLARVKQAILAGDADGYRPKPEMFTLLHHELPWQDAKQPDTATLSEHWYRVSAACMVARPDALTTLGTLQEQGYKLGLITNGQTKAQNATLDAIGLRGFFEVVIVSETVGLRKPNPRIFASALDRLGATAAQAVYVGDNPQADVEGARGAGLSAVWFDRGRKWPEDLPTPGHAVQSLSALPGLFT